MPPALAGYRRYCPYTRDPSASGTWHGPDLAPARKLVAASGTAGMRVTVWDTVTPPGTVNETRPAVTPNEVDLLSRRAGNFQYNPVWGALIDQLWVR